MISDDKLAELEALREKATPGEWIACNHNESGRKPNQAVIGAGRGLHASRKVPLLDRPLNVIARSGQLRLRPDNNWEQDRPYIIAAANSIGPLLERLRAAEDALNEIDEQNTQFHVMEILRAYFAKTKDG